MKKKYNHTVEKHNLLSPNNIVPVIIELIEPKSVIDIGCGLGTFLRVFKENGVQKVLGIDGPWVKKELLFQNIDENEFIETEIEKPLEVENKFDLLVCLEVAEHLSPQRGETIVSDLCKLSDVILFSAAIPFQGGDHHYNEQWISYWENKFKKEGYIKRDILKPIFWANEDVFWWYKQNMVIFTKPEFKFKSNMKLVENTLTNIIHPELFLTVVDYKEKNAVKRYTRALFKALMFKLGFIK